MRLNYFTIHKNKKPKKAKYSKPLSKLSIKELEECRLIFLREIELLKTKNNTLCKQTN